MMEPLTNVKFTNAWFGMKMNGELNIAQKISQQLTVLSHSSV